MIESHAFGEFIPSPSRYLLLGSFPVKQSSKKSKFYDESYDWFYSIKRNQFWPLLEEVYGVELKDKRSKQKLMAELGMAMADIILKCERKSGSNLDANLTNFVYNLDAISKILAENRIEKIFFTSRFVETKFRQVFKDIITNYPTISLVTLPSPSPRYVLISKEQKLAKYKELLPTRD